MQRIVIIANGAAYGSESLFNSLRLAIALREQQSDLDLKLFLEFRKFTILQFGSFFQIVVLFCFLDLFIDILDLLT